jgi:hypothetical protein
MGVKGRAYGLPGSSRTAAHLLTDADIPPEIARDTEVSAAVIIHTSPPDPEDKRHITVSITAPTGPSVNDLWLDIS